MFHQIGRKVRGLAVAVCTIGIIGSLGAGVALYLLKILQLIPCIAIGVGGAIVSWLCAGLLYCIGDTNGRVARLEDKLIPKPKYTEYLNTNVALRGQCELCGKNTDLINAKIEDSFGTRYRKVCKECFALNHAEQTD